MFKNGITNQYTIRIKKDNMTDKQIEQLAQKIAKLIINNLHEGLISGLNEWEPDEEEDLLAELAKCMTLLDKYLKAEQYEKCELMKNKIREIENKLKNL